jgi:hypothetical protein
MGTCRPGSHVVVTARPGCVTTPPLATPGRLTFTRRGVSAILARVNRSGRRSVLSASEGTSLGNRPGPADAPSPGPGLHVLACGSRGGRTHRPADPFRRVTAPLSGPPSGELGKRFRMISAWRGNRLILRGGTKGTAAPANTQASAAR